MFLVIDSYSSKPFRLRWIRSIIYWLQLIGLFEVRLRAIHQELPRGCYTRFIIPELRTVVSEWLSVGSPTKHDGTDGGFLSSRRFLVLE